MQLDDFVRTFVKRWYVTAGLLTVAILGAFLYTGVSATNTAEATVSVPYSALTSWDSVVHGKALSERVATKLNDGTTGEELQSSYSGRFKVGTGRLVPIYAVRADHDDSDRAIVVADTVVKEAITLFEENRQANLDYVLAAYREQTDQAEAAASEALRELNTFLAENNAYSLTARLAEQSDLVDSLRQQAQFHEADGTLIPLVDPPELTLAKAELDRLLALEPEYGRLDQQVTLAQAAVSRLEAEVAALTVAGPGYQPTLDAANASLATAQTRLATAQTEIETFKTDSELQTDLPAAIKIQQSVVNQMLLQQVADSGNPGTVQAALTTAEARLLELQSAVPEFTRLARALADSETLASVRDQQELFLAQIPPTTDRIELVENASLVSGTWWTIIRYAVAVILAMFLSLTAVYFLAFFERVPPSQEEIELEFGAPMLARIPRA